jgi:hypothetical protein
MTQLYPIVLETEESGAVSAYVPFKQVVPRTCPGRRCLNGAHNLWWNFPAVRTLLCAKQNTSGSALRRRVGVASQP